MTPAVAWPDPVKMVRSVLLQRVPGVNVATATDSTFATASPSPLMRTPLILLEPVPAGRTDLYGYSMTTVLDVSAFEAAWSPARSLSLQVHTVLCSLAGMRTPFGVIDDITVSSNPGLLSYANPNVVRFLGTYEVTARR